MGTELVTDYMATSPHPTSDNYRDSRALATNTHTCTCTCTCMSNTGTYHSIVPESTNYDILRVLGEEGAIYHVAVGLTPPIIDIEVLHWQRMFRLLGRLDVHVCMHACVGWERGMVIE